MNKAFVLRISPSGIDRVPEALDTSEIIIGWSTTDLSETANLYKEEFRQRIHDVHYSDQDSYRYAGAAAGHLRRFIHEMHQEDLVVVPYGSNFFVAQVEGPTEYREDKVGEDTAHRRKVTWLNNGEGIPRRDARAALQARMSIRGTSADATDLIDEIQEALQQAQTGESPSFANDLRIRLVEQTLQEIRSGRIENFGFERLVANVMLSLGALEAPILNRATEDKGADILASFMLAQTFEFTVAIQVKHYKPDPPVESEVIDQLIAGMESAETNLGWVVTSGTFSEEAALHAAEKEEEYGYQIQLIDGEQLSAMIVEGGLHGVGDISRST